MVVPLHVLLILVQRLSDVSSAATITFFTAAGRASPPRHTPRTLRAHLELLVVHVVLVAADLELNDRGAPIPVRLQRWNY
eukprot:5534378-Heterocapsa_arctica.AAC.1